MVNRAQLGYLAMLSAATIWGCFPLLFTRLSDVPSIDVVAHRLIWSFAFLMFWLGFQGRFSELIRHIFYLNDLWRIALAALLVSSNWCVFVWSIAIGEAVEASIGYFLFPIMTVALGALFRGEKLNSLQAISIGFAAAAVLILSIGVGKLPWIALFLGSTFSLYGLVKSGISAGPVISVAIENILLLPIAMFWMFQFADHSIGFLASGTTSFWLILAGIATGIALVLLSNAAKTISFFSIGMLFYWNPVLQFLTAVLILDKAVDKATLIAVGFIVAACLIYLYDLRLQQQSRRL